MNSKTEEARREVDRIHEEMRAMFRRKYTKKEYWKLVRERREAEKRMYTAAGVEY